MLNRSQWQQVMDNLERIKSNVLAAREAGLLVDKKFNGNFDHIVKCLQGLAGAMQANNKAFTNWEVIES